jgi:hypothetical protein
VPLDAACLNLTAVASQARERPMPFTFTFAYTRGLLADAAATWLSDPMDDAGVQHALLGSCRQASQAVAARPDRAAAGA